jgi:hypothetical protein
MGPFFDAISFVILIIQQIKQVLYMWLVLDEQGITTWLGGSQCDVDYPTWRRFESVGLQMAWLAAAVWAGII